MSSPRTISVRSLALALSLGLAMGCSPAAEDETAEIIDNLERAGFPGDDIQVVAGKVYVGRDAEVSLAASREMIAPTGETEEQYRTTNLVSASITKICINGATYTGNYGLALDQAIQNFNEQGLRFTMARAPSSGCSFTINASIQPGGAGGVAGFPANGLPFGSFTLFDGLNGYSVDVIEHVITHELGHTIGFRHSDYFNRAISCGSGGNEGDAGVGAIHVPGTPTGAAVGGSVMNSCFRSTENGEFTGSDITALRALYPRPLPTPNPPTACGVMVAGQSLGVGNQLTSCDGRFHLVLQGDGNLVLYKNGTTALWHTGTFGNSAHFAWMQSDGNFVLYNTSMQALWHAGTFGNPGAHLALQNDGNLVIYRNGVALWHTGTFGN